MGKTKAENVSMNHVNIDGPLLFSALPHDLMKVGSELRMENCLSEFLLSVKEFEEGNCGLGRKLPKKWIKYSYLLDMFFS